ncbi:fatty acid CoA ligase family protein [Oligosphaera ethanolica]|uniref:Acyl-CoA synthetase (AMP-forming)/AMP-acid ligase II n=1 Tax=Oligosphaera ethanolica TaxID=760260 RepID=A0AAE3VIB7_9BACT|nr:fatty acid CoA ligase family protein [Oligosphaera ethanolica]MDQ0291077.1 acyl-CoA synthetase (AMP-forming)/AMP-acid ligase II [Oligosphaera ethanolica]
MTESMNIAQLLRGESVRQPRSAAVMYPSGRDAGGRVMYSHLTYAQLDAQSDGYAWALSSLGVRAGTKSLLMIRPSLEFYALVFALFKVGAVPVLIDPGMGWRGFLRCVAQVEPELFIGVPAAQVLKMLRPGPFKSVRVSITLGRRWFWGGQALSELPVRDGEYPLHEPAADDLAAVLFTSGSTGPAKGVSYTHRIFHTQAELVRREYGIKPGEMDLACFPLFSLFSVALGATTVIPDMDPTRPARVNPERILEPLRNLPVTYSFGSPTLWERVARHCVARDIRIPGLRRVVMAGSPVPGHVHEMLLRRILDEGAETYTPYGATESLPVANFRGSEMLAETWSQTRAGRGMCVGRPLPEVTLRIIKISDEAIARWDEALVLPQGGIGEICVKGPVVTREYFRRPEATALAKIAEGDAVWHRIGDVGYVDEQGRLWFCGRKAHRVETASGTLFSVCCEAIYNVLPHVHRSALVGVGARPGQTPVIILEPEEGQEAALVASLPAVRVAAKASALTAGIEQVLIHPAFPVDVRHNAKINREELALWAAGKIAGRD